MSTVADDLNLPPQKSIVFSLKYTYPHIGVKKASMVFYSKKNRDAIIHSWKTPFFQKHTVSPNSPWNRLLLAEQICNLNDEEGNVIIDSIPSEQISAAPEFDLIKQLNNAQLKLPKSYFLDSDEEGAHDTALSQEGLSTLMSYYGQATGIQGHVSMGQEEFINQLPEIIRESQNGPVACLVLLDPSKRHVTGFYFVQEDTQTTAYLFDTTGLTLPGYPCGLRGYHGTELNLHSILTALQHHQVMPAILPVNTAMTMQIDRYSCLMATLLFFNGMSKGEYHQIDDSGLCQVYGQQAIRENNRKHLLDINLSSFPVQLYTIEHLPLLVGCQKMLALLFVLEKLSNGDRIFPELVKYRSDWQARHANNVFWQACYVHLLQWMEHNAQSNTLLPLPDFEQLMKEGYTSRQEKSALEAFVEEKMNDIVPSAIEATDVASASASASMLNATKVRSEWIEQEKHKAVSFFKKLYEIEQSAIKLRLGAEISLADKAHQLHNDIFKHAENYFSKIISEQIFQNKCNNCIEEARGALEKHYLGRQILANIFLAFVGLGVFYVVAGLIHKKQTGRFLFFQNTIVNQLDETKELCLSLVGAH